MTSAAQRPSRGNEPGASMTTGSRKKKIPLWPRSAVSPLDSAVMKWLRRLPEAPVTSALIVANLAIYVWMVVGQPE